MKTFHLSIAQLIYKILLMFKVNFMVFHINKTLARHIYTISNFFLLYYHTRFWLVIYFPNLPKNPGNIVNFTKIVISHKIAVPLISSLKFIYQSNFFFNLLLGYNNNTYFNILKLIIGNHSLF